MVPCIYRIGMAPKFQLDRLDEEYMLTIRGTGRIHFSDVEFDNNRYKFYNSGYMTAVLFEDSVPEYIESKLQPILSNQPIEA